MDDDSSLRVYHARPHDPKGFSLARRKCCARLHLVFCDGVSYDVREWNGMHVRLRRSLVGLRNLVDVNIEYVHFFADRTCRHIWRCLRRVFVQPEPVLWNEQRVVNGELFIAFVRSVAHWHNALPPSQVCSLEIPEVVSPADKLLHVLIVESPLGIHRSGVLCIADQVAPCDNKRPLRFFWHGVP
ncbi:hypothetical protein D3C85_1315320 [compost metagenome]